MQIYLHKSASVSRPVQILRFAQKEKNTHNEDRKRRQQMLTSCVIVGKVVEQPKVIVSSRGNSLAYMVVETDRPFRNEDGTIGKDQFRVLLWRGIAEECADVCLPGTLVGIRGRLQSDKHEKDESTFYNMQVIAEKVSYYAA